MKSIKKILSILLAVSVITSCACFPCAAGYSEDGSANTQIENLTSYPIETTKLTGNVAGGGGGSVGEPLDFDETGCFRIEPEFNEYGYVSYVLHYVVPETGYYQLSRNSGNDMDTIRTSYYFMVDTVDEYPNFCGEEPNSYIMELSAGEEVLFEIHIYCMGKDKEYSGYNGGELFFNIKKIELSISEFYDFRVNIVDEQEDKHIIFDFDMPFGQQYALYYGTSTESLEDAEDSASYVSGGVAPSEHITASQYASVCPESTYWYFAAVYNSYDNSGDPVLYTSGTFCSNDAGALAFGTQEIANLTLYKYTAQQTGCYRLRIAEENADGGIRYLVRGNSDWSYGYGLSVDGVHLDAGNTVYIVPRVYGDNQSDPETIRFSIENSASVTVGVGSIFTCGFCSVPIEYEIMPGSSCSVGVEYYMRDEYKVLTGPHTAISSTIIDNSSSSSWLSGTKIVSFVPDNTGGDLIRYRLFVKDNNTGMRFYNILEEDYWYWDLSYLTFVENVPEYSISSTDVANISCTSADVTVNYASPIGSEFYVGVEYYADGKAVRRLEGEKHYSSTKTIGTESFSISELSDETLYSFRGYIRDVADAESKNLIYGELSSFTTEALPPHPKFNACNVELITYSSASLSVEAGIPEGFVGTVSVAYSHDGEHYTAVDCSSSRIENWHSIIFQEKRYQVDYNFSKFTIDNLDSGEKYYWRACISATEIATGNQTDIYSDIFEFTTNTPPEGVIASGFCGGDSNYKANQEEGCYENAFWTLSTDGTLTVSGTGAILDSYDANYRFNKGWGWDKYRDQIIRVYINDDITSVGDNAFDNIPYLIELQLPDSLTSFYLPRNCHLLETINIPKNVSYLGNFGLNSLKGLKSISVDPENETYFSENGVLYEYPNYKHAGAALICVPSKYSGVLSINNNTSLVDYFAIGSCPYIYDIVLSEALEILPLDDLSGLSGVTSIVVPESVSEISFDWNYAPMLFFKGNAPDFSENGTSVWDADELPIIYYVPGTSGWNDARWDSFELRTWDGVNPVRNRIGSGQCGEQVTWTLYEDGRMEISGTGPMYDYDGWSTFAPWFNRTTGYDIGKIESVLVKDGVTSLGEYAFMSDPPSLIWLSDTVETVKYACGYYQWLYLGSGVRILDEWALENFSAQGILVSPQNTAFKDHYDQLFIKDEKEIISFFSDKAFIPKSTETIADSALERATRIDGFYVEDGNGFFSVYDGALYSADRKTLVLTPYSYNTKRLVVPAGVTHIGNYACYSKNYESITLPEGLTDIGISAFSNCRYLSELNLPSTVETLGEYALSSCEDLVSVVIPEGVTILPDHLLYNCQNLHTLSLPLTLTEIGFQAINRTALTDIYYAGSEEAWGQIEIGRYNDLNGATIHYGQAEQPLSDKCGDNAYWSFDESSGTLSITGSGAMWDYKNAPLCGQENAAKVKSVVIGDGITYIGKNIFSAFKVAGFAGIESITIGENVTEIGEYAFYGLRNVKSLVIPDSVASLGKFAFAGCGITNLHIGSGVVSMGSSVFGKSDAAYSDENPLTNIYFDIPEIVSNQIVYNNFFNCGVEHLTFGENVVDIYGFNGCEKLTDITFLGSPRYINNQAFYGCIKLKSIVIPNSITYIGQSAFYKCESLESMVLPNGLRTIGDEAFSNCSGLTSVHLPEGIINIGKYIFTSCSSLKTVNIPSDWTEIPEGFLRFCDSLTEISLPSGITKIGDWAFYMSSLSNFVWPSGLKEIGERAFYASKITNGQLPESVEKIGFWAFGSCTELEKLVIGKNVTELEPQFSGVNGAYAKLKTVEIYAPLAELPHGDGYGGFFGGIGSLETVVLPDTLTSIGKGEFSCCHTLKNVNIPAGVRSIGYQAFYECTSLKTLQLPSALESIGASAFSKCELLEDLTFPEGLQNIGEDAFYDCERLNRVVLPNSLTAIGSTAFGGTDLSYVSIGTGLSFIPMWTFSHVAYLKLPDDIEIEQSPYGYREDAFGQVDCIECSVYSAEYLPEKLVKTSAYKYAESRNLSFSNGSIVPVPLTVSMSGICSATGSDININWTLSPDGTLTLIGKGTKSFYEFDEDYKWFVPRCNQSYWYYDEVSAENITWADLYMYVTSIESKLPIGKTAFSGYPYLRSVHIDSTVYGIRERAFSNCKNLERVEIEGGMGPNRQGIKSMHDQTIDDYAFDECVKLSYVRIPVNFYNISASAFADCTGLKTIDFGSTQGWWDCVYKPGEHDTDWLENVQVNFIDGAKPSGHPAPGHTTIKVDPLDRLLTYKASTYNNDLALIAAKLCDATYSAGSDSSSDVEYYLAQLGFSYDKMYSNNYGGSLAFTVASKKDTNKPYSDDGIIAIVCQGSTNLYELWMDSFSSSGTMYGGRRIYDIVKDFKNAVYEGLPKVIEPGKKYKVLVTGHSLGGAAADYIAAMLTDNGFKNISINSENVFCYTFGAINSNTSDKCAGYSNIHNIYNDLDTFSPTQYGAVMRNGAGRKYGKFGHLDSFVKEYRTSTDKNKLTVTQVFDAVNHGMGHYLDAVENGYVQNSVLRSCLYSTGEADLYNSYSMVACPVDVDVLCEGKVVGRIVNDVADENYNGVDIITIDDKKIILYPDDKLYSLDIKAREEGEMTYFTQSFGEGLVSKLFTGIALENDLNMSSTIGDTIRTDETQLLILDENGGVTAQIDVFGNAKPIDTNNLCFNSCDYSVEGNVVSVTALIDNFTDNEVTDCWLCVGLYDNGRLINTVMTQVDVIPKGRETQKELELVLREGWQTSSELELRIFCFSDQSFTPLAEKETILLR